MQKQKKIMPTFNKIKRPRQALFAHPNNENSSNLQGSYPSPSASNCCPSKQPRTAPNSQNPGRPPPMNNNNNNGPSWNGNSNNNNNNNSAFFQPNFQVRTSPAASSYQNPWHSSPAPSPGHGFGGAPSASVGAESVNSSWQRWAGVNNPGPPSRSPAQMRGPHAGGGPGQEPHGQQWFPSQPHPSSAPPCRTQNYGPPSNPFPPRQSPRPNPPNFQQHQMSGGTEKPRGSGFAVDDRSLKVLSASITDTKSLSQQVDKVGSLVCEVFGMMNSAVSSDVSGAAKMFTLKDEEQKTLKCIFYETDRSLPRLTRDQWLRCVGSLDRRSSLFRCVSVRQASPAERQVMKSLTTASSNTMRERLAAVQEP